MSGHWTGIGYRLSNRWVGSICVFSNLSGGPLDGIPDIQKVIIAAPAINRPNQYNARFDFTPNAKDQIAFSTYLTRNFSIGSDSSGGARPQADITSSPHNTALTFLYNRIISATLLNEARFNFTQFAYNEIVSSRDTNFGLPRVELENLLSNGDRIRFGANQAETTPGIFAEKTFEFRDVVSKVHGNHALKFGGEYRKELNNDNLNGASRPLYTFSGPFNFANDTPSFYQINADPRTGGPADAQRHFRSGGYAFFHPGRLEGASEPNFQYWTSLRILQRSYGEGQQGLQFCIWSRRWAGWLESRAHGLLYNPDRNNFAPRLGFAYSPKYFGLEQKLVLRGGFGISYNRTEDVVFSNSRESTVLRALFNLLWHLTARLR